MKRFLFLPLALVHVAIFSNVASERDWLKHEYLPSLEGRILFVGVNYYNADYHTYVKAPELYETIDLVEDRAQFGSPYKHYTGEFMDLEPGYLYDHISLFGVMGHKRDFSTGDYYTIDEEELITQSLEHAHKLLKMGGTLQLGPNRICVSKFNTAYWYERFKKYPLDKYEIIMNTTGPCNMVWWGKKVRE